MCLISISGWIITGYADVSIEKKKKILDKSMLEHIETEDLYKLTQHWTTGGLYKNKSFIFIGLACQWLPILASAFINTWWSSFLVLLASFIASSFLINTFGSKVQAIPFLFLISSLFIIFFNGF